MRPIAVVRILRTSSQNSTAWFARSPRKDTASYPDGARFVRNVKVLREADLYLNRLSSAQRALFLDAMRQRQVALNAAFTSSVGVGLVKPLFTGVVIGLLYKVGRRPLQLVGPALTFWIYSGFSLLAFLMVLAIVPETKGRSLEEIEEYWQQVQG